ncbi:MAG: hypothetical protein GY884_09630 [Proteobacteria bacterium]|nr:hypothetical protein [Pseudomonadota bacterium]
MLLSLLACSTFDTTLVGQNDNCDPLVWYIDSDGDGFGADEAVASCEAPDDGVTEGGDCNDADPDVHPDGFEVCNEIDDDCNGEIDDDADDAETYWADADGDVFGDPDSPIVACEPPDDAVTNELDCDDEDAEVNPAATEICNGIDDDCDGGVDDDAVDALTWYQDADGDDWGVDDDTALACEQPDGFADNADDCDDGDAELNESCTEDPAIHTGTCTGTLYTWADEEPGDPELHILSAYEADGGHGGPAGNIAITIDRETEMTLVLASYENVDWTVTVAPGTTLNAIYVTGYHEQAVTAPSGVPVSIRSYDQTGSYYGNWCGYSWPYAGGGCDTSQLVSGVETELGMDLSSFAGCYHSTAFTLE